MSLYQHHTKFLPYVWKWMLVFAIVAIGIFAGISTVVMRQMNAEIISERSQDILEHSQSSLQKETEGLYRALQLLAADEDIAALLRRQIAEDTISESEDRMLRSRLFGVLSGRPRGIMLSLVAPGRTWSTEIAPPIYDFDKFSDWGVLRRAKEARGLQLYANQYKRQSGDQNACSLSYALYDGSELLGVLVADFSLGYFEELFASIRKDYIGEAYFLLTGAEGDIIYRSDDGKGVFAHLFVSSVADTILAYDESYIQEAAYNSLTGVRAIAFIHKNYILSPLRIYYRTLFVAVMLSLLLASGIGGLIGKKMIAPIIGLAERVRSMKAGDRYVQPTRSDEIGEIEEAFIALIDQIERHHEQEAVQQRELNIAELQMLASQMNPHFLYNALDSIKWQAKLYKLDDVARMAIELGHVLKHTMSTHQAVISLEEELAIIESYLFIQHQRYDDLFSYSQEIEPALMDMKIPKFLLQPLIENAIVHGLEEQEESVLISLKAYSSLERDGDVIFEVADSGKGFSRTLEEIFAEEPFSEGLGEDAVAGCVAMSAVEGRSLKRKSIALSNLQKRIELRYGEGYGLRLLEPYERRGSRIELRIARDIVL